MYCADQHPYITHHARSDADVANYGQPNYSEYHTYSGHAAKHPEYHHQPGHAAATEHNRT